MPATPTEMRRVLVTGASGFVGSALIPCLLKEGHEVRAFARTPSKVQDGIEIAQGDAITGEGLPEAMQDVEVAYFLMHSMEGSEDGFDDAEQRSAEHFVSAAQQAGVRRVVYLGGLPPSADGDASRHLQSRLDVERLLLDGFPEGAAFRASVVIGAGSRSFELLVDLVERMPLLALPAWRSNQTRPIDLRDVLAYLTLAATSPNVDGPHVYEIGGGDELTYGQIVETIAELHGQNSQSIGLPFTATKTVSRAAALLSGEDHGLIEPLMESLAHNLLPNDTQARAAFHLEPRGFVDAVTHALSQRAEHAHDTA